MYSKDFRERALGYMNEGHSYTETMKVFKVGHSTLDQWIKLKEETGGLDRRPHNKAVTKYDRDKLRKLVKEHPLWNLADFAKEFEKGQAAGVSAAFKRIGITQKKRLVNILNEMKQKEPNSTLNLHKLMRKHQ